jgi:hypothetical protein
MNDKDSNLNAMTSTLKFVVSYETSFYRKVSIVFVLGIFFKACQYAIDDEKLCNNLKYVSIKATQTNLQSVGLRHLGRVGKSGRKLVLFLKFTLGNSMKIR